MEAWIKGGEIYVKVDDDDKLRLKRHLSEDQATLYLDRATDTLSTLPPGTALQKWKEVLTEAWNDKVPDIDAPLPKIRCRWTKRNENRLNAAIGRGDCERILYVIDNLQYLHFHVYEWGGITLWWLFDRPDRIDGLIASIKTAMKEREDSDVF